MRPVYWTVHTTQQLSAPAPSKQEYCVHVSDILFVCLSVCIDDHCSTHPITVAVSITQSPVDTSVNRESSVNLTCTATGVPTPMIIWYKQLNNGTLQLISGTGAYSISAVTSDVNRTSQLTIPNAAVLDTGNYLCRAFNLAMNTTSDAAYLTVIGEW